MQKKVVIALVCLLPLTAFAEQNIAEEIQERRDEIEQMNELYCQPLIYQAEEDIGMEKYEYSYREEEKYEYREKEVEPEASANSKPRHLGSKEYRKLCPICGRKMSKRYLGYDLPAEPAKFDWYWECFYCWHTEEGGIE